MAEFINICSCGATEPENHPYKHSFIPSQKMERINKSYFILDANDWPKKEILSKCTFPLCNRTVENHQPPVAHVWSGNVIQKREILIELPRDTKCTACGVCAAEPHPFRHFFTVRATIQNKTDNDVIDFKLPNGRQVYITRISANSENNTQINPISSLNPALTQTE
jgi:hypothetical protein